MASHSSRYYHQAPGSQQTHHPALLARGVAAPAAPAAANRPQQMVQKKPELESPSPVFGRQFDSGFSSGFTSGSFFSIPQVEADCATYTGAPPPPHLILPPNNSHKTQGHPVDAENGDSGINMDDEKDCGVVFKGQVQTLIPSVTPSPMEVERTELPRSPKPSRRSPVLSTARKVPRLPRRTISGTTSSSSTTSSSGPSSMIARTLMTPQRAPSPKSTYTESRTYTYTTTSTSYNKENNMQQGPYSLPAPRSSSPLTHSNMNNFQSLNVNVLSADRVPGVVPLDISQLQDYMGLFLPDSKDGDTGFHLSVIHNQPDVLDRLLFIMSKERALRSVIDEQNRLYQTALHLATHLQQVETMRKLLIAGASVNITDHKGNTPLHIAAKFSSTRPLEEIIRYTSIQTILEVSQVRNNEGLSCVHIAAKHGNMEVLRKLKSLGVDMEMQDFNGGKTALHLAVESNSLANVQFLLETCEADVNSLTYSGCSPLHIASGRGDISIVAYLVSMGADPDLYTDEGDVALELAGSAPVQTFLTKAAALQWLY